MRLPRRAGQSSGQDGGAQGTAHRRRGGVHLCWGAPRGMRGFPERRAPCQTCRRCGLAAEGWGLRVRVGVVRQLSARLQLAAMVLTRLLAAMRPASLVPSRTTRHSWPYTALVLGLGPVSARRAREDRWRARDPAPPPPRRALWSRAAPALLLPLQPTSRKPAPHQPGPSRGRGGGGRSSSHRRRCSSHTAPASPLPWGAGDACFPLTAYPLFTGHRTAYSRRTHLLTC